MGKVCGTDESDKEAESSSEARYQRRPATRVHAADGSVASPIAIAIRARGTCESVKPRHVSGDARRFIGFSFVRRNRSLIPSFRRRRWSPIHRLFVSFVQGRIVPGSTKRHRNDRLPAKPNRRPRPHRPVPTGLSGGALSRIGARPRRRAPVPSRRGRGRLRWTAGRRVGRRTGAGRVRDRRRA